jgi:hypothetical protein
VALEVPLEGVHRRPLHRQDSTKTDRASFRLLVRIAEVELAHHAALRPRRSKKTS